jgi:hypothetical protein
MKLKLSSGQRLSTQIVTVMELARASNTYFEVVAS